MKEENVYEKRTLKDYAMSYKPQVIQKIERGDLSVTGAKRKYGTQGRLTFINWSRKFGTID